MPSATMSSGRIVLVDTSVLVALIDRRDKWHLPGQSLAQALASHDMGLLYADCVINETISVLARRCWEQGRQGTFSGLLDTLQHHVPTESITWISKQTEVLYGDVVQAVRRPDGALNFHDALMAVYCTATGVGCVASFDQDFDLVEGIRRLSTPQDVTAVIEAESAEIS